MKRIIMFLLFFVIWLVVKKVFQKSIIKVCGKYSEFFYAIRVWVAELSQAILIISHG